MAAIGALVTVVLVVVIAAIIVAMLCRNKPKQRRLISQEKLGSPSYTGSLLAGSKPPMKGQPKTQNGSSAALVESNPTATTRIDQNELNYDDMPRGRRPIQIVNRDDDGVIYSTIVGTMQPKNRSNIDFGPIDRV